MLQAKLHSHRESEHKRSESQPNRDINNPVMLLQVVVSLCIPLSESPKGLTGSPATFCSVFKFLLREIAYQLNACLCYNLLKFKASIRMGNKGDLSERTWLVGTRCSVMTRIIKLI